MMLVVGDGKPPPVCRRPRRHRVYDAPIRFGRLHLHDRPFPEHDHVTILDNSPPGDTDASSIDEPVGKAGDKIFFGLSFGAAALILVTLAAVAIFLFLEGLPIFTSDTAELDGDGSFVSYVGPLVFGTIYISVMRWCWPPRLRSPLRYT